MKKTIAVDFDGTICLNRWPHIGSPRDEVIAALKEQADAGATLILWTCRTGEKLEAAVAFCTEHGLVFAAVNECTQDAIALFGGDTRKVWADEYWDDKAIKIGPVEYTIHTPSHEGYDDVHGSYYACTCGANYIDIKAVQTDDWAHCPHCGRPIAHKEMPKV